MLFVVLDLVVNLQPVAVGLQDDDTVLTVHIHSYGPVEAPFGLHVGSAPGLDDIGVGVDVRLGPRRGLLGVAHQCGDELSFRTVDLETVITPVGNVNIPFLVYGHAGGAVKVSHPAVGPLKFA